MFAGEATEAEIRRERQSFILLQHVHTLTRAEPRCAISVRRAALDLGFAAAEIQDLVRHLVDVGYLVPGRGDTALQITPLGTEYIERLARRRRSVRRLARC